MTPSQDSSEKPDSTLEQVLDQYLEELADGLNPDQEKYLKEYPDLAKALRGVFKTLDFVETASKSLNAGQLEKGQRLGEFEIIGEVGRGGMGVVYEAIQTSLERKVALKVLAMGAMMSENAVERFAREAATAGKLHHTNIVPVYAVGEDQGIHYYVMQYIEGQSLSQVIEKIEDPRSSAFFNRTAHLGVQVADALHHAHGMGAIHRDIKPANLLVDSRDNIWITDFGLARTTAMATITVTGDVIGTARYMSPEQARGGRSPVDLRTDIYSLGITLYELITQKPAYEGETRDAVLNRIITDPPPPMEKQNPKTPKDLVTIVNKCMAKDPNHRYQTAGQVADDLRFFMKGLPIKARRTPLVIRAARFIKRYKLRFIASLLILILGVILFFMVQNVRQQKGAKCMEQAFGNILVSLDHKKANNLLDEAEAYGVDSSELYLYRGLIPLLNSQPQKSIPLLKKALELSPDHLETYYALSYAYLESADMESAGLYLKKAEEKEIQSALGWLLRGCALSQDSSKESILAVNQALSLRSDLSPALKMRADYRANILLTQGAGEELAPMIKDYDACLLFQPASTGAYASRAKGWLFAAAYGKNKPEYKDKIDVWLQNCKNDLKESMALAKETNLLGKSLNGTFLRYLNDYPGSADSFAAANEAFKTSANKDHPALMHQMAISLYAAGELENALDTVDRAIITWPDNVFPFPLQKALLQAELGLLDEGRKSLIGSLKHQKANAVWLLTSLAGLRLLGDNSTGRDALLDILDKTEELEQTGQGNMAPALNYLAGKITDQALMDSANDIPGLQCEFSFLVALNHYSKGDRKTGIQYFETCLDTGVVTYVQYRFAQALYARALADNAWPSWIP